MKNIKAAVLAVNCRIISCYFFTGVILCGCGNQSSSSEKTNRYFDLEGYFQKEIERLNSSDYAVEKTVSDNRETESRTLQQIDWETELALFRESGINKPAWRDSYTVDSSGKYLHYEATDPDLRIRSISITKNDLGKITGIEVQRQETNILYTSGETLRYFPDSLYIIERHQKIKMLGKDHFVVEGKFIGWSATARQQIN